MKNKMEYEMADSMFRIISKCMQAGVIVALLLSMFSVFADQLELADFLLRSVAFTVFLVCSPLLAILAIVKHLNK